MQELGEQRWAEPLLALPVDLDGGVARQQAHERGIAQDPLVLFEQLHPPVPRYLQELGGVGARLQVRALIEAPPGSQGTYGLVKRVGELFGRGEALLQIPDRTLRRRIPGFLQLPVQRGIRTERRVGVGFGSGERAFERLCRRACGVGNGFRFHQLAPL